MAGTDKFAHMISNKFVTDDFDICEWLYDNALGQYCVNVRIWVINGLFTLNHRKILLESCTLGYILTEASVNTINIPRRVQIIGILDVPDVI